jgi:DNA mismatch endonuclease (patch repair protein)
LAKQLEKDSSNSQRDAAPRRTIKVRGVSLPYPEPTSPAVSAQMRGNRRVDTGPERIVRSLLHQRGLRFRKNATLKVEGVRVTADIVFPSKSLAVFIDGCFWHGCPDHGRSPKANPRYWNAKLARNVERDARNSSLLRAAGWTVLRYWEHESPDEVAQSIADQVGQTDTQRPVIGRQIDAGSPCRSPESGRSAL